jgi:uncharacterized phage-associated protein
MAEPRKWSPVTAAQLDELVLFVCGLANNPAELGATKLQKVFWYADRMHMARHGRPIAGVVYRRLPQGPFSPAIDKAVKRLKRASRLAEREGERFGYQQRQFFALDEADVSGIDSSAIQVLAEATLMIKDISAAAISDLSHTRLWQITEPGAVLPIERMLAGAAEPLDEIDVKALKAGARTGNGASRKVKAVA